MSKTIRMTIGDTVLVASLVLLAVGMFFLLPGWVASGGTDVEIRSDERVVGRYALDEDRSVDVQGALGATRVRINRGTATVVSSPCPNKICIHMGEVDRRGGLVVCVPNRVVVTVGTGLPAGVDAVSR